MIHSASFADSFEYEPKVSSFAPWSLYKVSSEEELDDLARRVATLMMWFRCKGAPHIFADWAALARGDYQPTDAKVRRLEPFIQTAFGLPNARKDEDHAEGLVAEFLWWILIVEKQGDDAPLKRVTDPHFDVTGHGADGLCVHSDPDGGHRYRLWEVKKHYRTSPVSGTISKAYGQLKSRSLEYLARYTILAEAEEDPSIRDLYARLVDSWETEISGIGVAVATSHRSAPNRCFSTMADHFPRLAHPRGLSGLVAAVGDFREFTLRVREYVWNALLTET